MPMKAVGPLEKADPEVGRTIVWRGSDSRYYVAKVLHRIGAGNYIVKDCQDGSEGRLYDEQIIAKVVHEETEKAVSPQARMNELSVSLRQRKNLGSPREAIFSDFDTWLANEAAHGCGEADELLGLRQQVEQERATTAKGPGPVQWRRFATAEELIRHLDAPSKMEPALKLIAELTHPANCDPSKELLHHLATTALENTK